MTATKEREPKSSVQLKSDENVLAMYLNEISRIPLLSREAEEETARLAAKGNAAARNKLVNANLRFVVNVAKRYQGQGIPLEDLISEGNIGLINAASRFDVDKGYHFISYAVYWIRQTILKALYDTSRMIRLPQNKTAELIQVERARKLLNGHETAEGEIREIAGLLGMEKEYIEELIDISREMVSLENPVSTERDSVLGDFIIDEHYLTPDEQAIQQMLEEDIEKVLSTLDKKETVVIRHRYGLGNRPTLSLKELGDRLNLTKERIRQIEKKAILRLQHPARMEKLREYA
jgi:RNA polymerase primary sigma factor